MKPFDREKAIFWFISQDEIYDDAGENVIINKGDIIGWLEKSPTYKPKATKISRLEERYIGMWRFSEEEYCHNSAFLDAECFGKHRNIDFHIENSAGKTLKEIDYPERFNRTRWAKEMPTDAEREEIRNLRQKEGFYGAMDEHNILQYLRGISNLMDCDTGRPSIPASPIKTLYSQGILWHSGMFTLTKSEPYLEGYMARIKEIFAPSLFMGNEEAAIIISDSASGMGVWWMIWDVETGRWGWCETGSLLATSKTTTKQQEFALHLANILKNPMISDWIMGEESVADWESTADDRRLAAAIAAGGTFDPNTGMISGYDHDWNS